MMTGKKTINSRVNKVLMMRTIEVEKKYRHFKGNYYYVMAIAKHSETGELYVVYKLVD